MLPETKLIDFLTLPAQILGVDASKVLYLWC